MSDVSSWRISRETAKRRILDCSIQTAGAIAGDALEQTHIKVNNGDFFVLYTALNVYIVNI